MAVLALACLALGLGAPGAVAATPERIAGQSGIPGFTRDAPFNVTGPVTDRAGVLGGDVADLESRIARLRDERGLQLFVVFVDSFDGATGEDWAQRTFQASGMGGDDVLLAVAVEDRRYSTWTTAGSGLTQAQDAAVRRQFIEPALADDQWSDAVRGAVDGYSRAAEGEVGGAGEGRAGGGQGGSGGGFPWAVLLVPAGVGGVALLLAGRRRSRRRGQSGQGVGAGAGAPGDPGVPTEELQRRAAAALVDLDDAIRSSSEELGFAEAQFGVQATQRFKSALEDARHKAARAFQLQQQLSDDEGAGALDDAGKRARLAEILSLTTEADRSLDEQEAEFVRLRDLQATVPAFLSELRGRLDEVKRRLPAAEQELAGLSVQHSTAALRTVSGNVEQSRGLLASAEGFISTGEQHLRSGDDRAAAVAAARAAEEAIGQADALLTSVANARRELAEAGHRIDQSLASLSSDIADAERLGANDQLTLTALDAAQQAIQAGSAAKDGGDPLAALRALIRAEHDLDNALARYREQDAHASRSRQLLAERMGRVRARLESVDATISSRRGAVGHDARTRIAEAIRLYNQATQVAEEDPDSARALLDRAEDLAEVALELAQNDISSWGGPRGGMPGGYGGGRGIDAGSLILGGILGGMGGGGGWGGGRGGGWGGSGGGFGGGGSFGGGGGFGGGGRF